ncbi:Unannotated [Lentimonas sp. CC19]|nr:Unannotated [Lentimonas sp. CC10]CAA6693048.1 Unannotated [Lentimonas sp. CC19]CAA7069045.1 Unannotated [Lentimonas sp. CC11]
MIVACTALPHVASAIVFDFDDVDFTDGLLDQSFDIDPDNEGDDIRISFTKDNDYFQEYDGQQSPYTSGLFGDGTAPSEESLALIVNFGEETLRVRVRVDFLYESGVSAVQLPIYDIDVGSDAGGGAFTFTDQVSQIRSRMVAGDWTYVDASTIALDASTNAYSEANNSIYGIAGSDNNAAEGNILVEFGDAEMKRLTFLYSNFTATTPDDPALQGIGIGDIEYTPILVPEYNQAALCLGLVALGYVSTRRRAA